MIDAEAVAWLGYWLNRLVSGWLRGYEAPWHQIKEEADVNRPPEMERDEGVA